MERLLSTTMLLGMAGLALGCLWIALDPGSKRPAALRSKSGQAAGFFVAAASLAFASGIMTLTMLGSHDASERRAVFAVYGILAAGVALAGVRRFAATHRNPVIRDGVDRFVHGAASRIALASLAAVLGLMAVWLHPHPVGLAGFLLANLALLGWAAGQYAVRYGWNAAWFRPFVTLFVAPGPSRPAAIALADAWREYLALTPKARGAMKDAFLGPFLASFAMTFAIFLPLSMVLRQHGALASIVTEACFGVMGGSLFILMLPVMLLMGFAFAFILMPLGLLRTVGGASGGAGASGEI